MSLGPELGTMVLASTPEQVATEDVILEFLGMIDPAELEVLALSQLGGLVGEQSVGACFLQVLKELAGGG